MRQAPIVYMFYWLTPLDCHRGFCGAKVSQVSLYGFIILDWEIFLYGCVRTLVSLSAIFLIAATKYGQKQLLGCFL